VDAHLHILLIQTYSISSPSTGSYTVCIDFQTEPHAVNHWHVSASINIPLKA